MQGLKAIAGLRSLSSIIATASSARVLDLHSLAVQDVDDPDYAEHPMFIHPVLNRAIILKHNPRPGEADRLPPGRFNATKVIFPFDPTDLDLGGQWLFVGQRNFGAVLARHLDYTELSMERDVAVLKVLDRLPTLDPFLIRESLNQQKIEVGRCYYRFSESDQAEMLGFVAGEIEALVQLCFGDLKDNQERTQRLSHLLLANQHSAELEPLRETFRMDAAEFSEAMFCWKAFLYYHWRSRALAPLLKATLGSISNIRAGRHERDELAFVLRSKRLLERTVTYAWSEVRNRLKLYDEAFASLTTHGSPDAFRAFLVHSSSHFISLGDRVGRLEQMVGFWRERFGDQHIGGASSDDVLGGMRDLLQALSLELSVKPPLPELVPIPAAG
jgi:hypothetical protein